MNKLFQQTTAAGPQLAALLQTRTPPGASPQPPQSAPQGMPPQGMPPQTAPPSYSREEVDGHRNTLGVIHDALFELAQKPKGSLSKQDLYNAVADMIAGGAFSGKGEKEAIVAQLAQMPDDEAAIRQVVGQKLLRLASVREAYHQHFGAGED